MFYATTKKKLFKVFVEPFFKTKCKGRKKHINKSKGFNSFEKCNIAFILR